jgi:hypothetical protein
MPVVTTRGRPRPTDPGLAPPDVVKRCLDKVGLVPRGVRANNPGNLERGKKPWVGEVNDGREPRFAQFKTPEDGIRAIGVCVMTYVDHRKANDGSAIDSVDDIINRWAPSHENDTRAYAAHVAALLKVDPFEKVNFYAWDNIRALTCGLIEHENGLNPYSDTTIDTGLLKAGFKRPAATVTAERTTDRMISAAGVAAGGGAAVLSTVVAVLPAVTEAYKQATISSSALAEIAPWLPIVFGVLAAGTVVALAVRNARLARLVDGRSPP